MTAKHWDAAIGIMQLVALHYHIKLADILGKARPDSIVIPRHNAMWLVRKLCHTLSLNDIGALFGNRDHGTILHGVNMVEQRISVYHTHRDEIRKLLADCVQKFFPNDQAACEEIAIYERRFARV